MATLSHPRIPNVTVDVPDSDVRRWQSSGWVADEAIEDFHQQSDGDGLADELVDFDTD